MAITRYNAERTRRCAQLTYLHDEGVPLPQVSLERFERPTTPVRRLYDRAVDGQHEELEADREREKVVRGGALEIDL